MAETQQALRDALAQPRAPQQEGVGSDLRAELDGLHARQTADTEDLKSKLAESGQVLAEVRQALHDNQLVLAQTQRAPQDTGASPCVPQQKEAKPRGLPAFAGPPDTLSLVALVEQHLQLDKKTIYQLAMKLQVDLEGQPPTVGRRQLMTAVTDVLEKYESSSDELP